MNQTFLRQYARILIECGVQTVPGQKLVIIADPRDREFVLMLTEFAYQKGAASVRVDWADNAIDRLFYRHASDETIATVEPWLSERSEMISQGNTARLNIRRTPHRTFSDVDPKKLRLRSNALAKVTPKSRDLTSKSLRTWCVADMVDEEWASVVFPELPIDEAVEKLWKAVFRVVRADREDPVSAWKEHAAQLKSCRDRLNSMKIESLHFKSSTADLRIDLVKDHYWQGGEKQNEFGNSFIANIPTEEVHTMPNKTGVNGWVRNTKPLTIQGQLVDDFCLTFQDGKLVDWDIKTGAEVFEELLKTDANSLYLGEVALVPFSSPIGQSGIIFHDTLFDENASCHLALGNAYPASMIGGKQMDWTELEQKGANHSLIHTDFMIGSQDLCVIASTPEGEVELFRDGEWAIR